MAQRKKKASKRTARKSRAPFVPMADRLGLGGRRMPGEPFVAEPGAAGRDERNAATLARMREREGAHPGTVLKVELYNRISPTGRSLGNGFYVVRWTDDGRRMGVVRDFEGDEAGARQYVAANAPTCPMCEALTASGSREPCTLCAPTPPRRVAPRSPRRVGHGAVVREGYVPCACRDCFDTAIGRAGKALCGDCDEAGCEANNGECRRDDAYGMDGGDV